MRRRAATPAAERVILTPGDRRQAVIDLIQSARRRLKISVFRCDDFPVLDALDEAVRRGVEVEALLTQRARGWETRLRDLERLLENMGVRVHRYPDSVVKYHAKYFVADEAQALVASLNLTRKCFTQTCDFVCVTADPSVVNGLLALFASDCQKADSPLPADLPDRLIVGPEQARARFAALLRQARRSIGIIDHRVTDPEILAILKTRRADGVTVRVLGQDEVAGLRSHGRLLVVDEREAVIGSISLAAPSMDFRREVALLVREPACVRQLAALIRGGSRKEKRRVPRALH